MREVTLQLLKSGDVFAYWSTKMYEKLVFYPSHFIMIPGILISASINEVKAEFKEIDMQEKARFN